MYWKNQCILNKDMECHAFAYAIPIAHALLFAGKWVAQIHASDVLWQEKPCDS